MTTKVRDAGYGALNPATRQTAPGDIGRIIAHLESFGYKVTSPSDDLTSCSVEVVQGLPATISIGNNHSTGHPRLTISCAIAKLGDFKEEDLPKLAFNCLDANTLTSPYAFALLTQADDPKLVDPKEFVLLLTNEVPLDGLSEGEIREAMDTLHTALVTAQQTLADVRRAPRAKKPSAKKVVRPKVKGKGK